MLTNWWLLSHLSVFKAISLTLWKWPDNPSTSLLSHEVLVIHRVSGIVFGSFALFKLRVGCRIGLSAVKIIASELIDLWDRRNLETHFSTLLRALGSWSLPKTCSTSSPVPSGFQVGLPMRDNSRRWKAGRKFYPAVSLPWCTTLPVAAPSVATSSSWVASFHCWRLFFHSSTGILEQHCLPLPLQAWR